jgi:hypothetical protein
MWILLEKLAELVVGQRIKVEALGTHLLVFVVLPVSLPYLAWRYWPATVKDWFYETRPGVKHLVLGLIGVLPVYGLLTIPPPQPPGHGPVIGIAAFPKPDEPLVFRPDSLPPPETRDRRRPPVKTHAPMRPKPRAPVLVADILFFSVEGVVNQLPEMSLTEFDSAPRAGDPTRLVTPTTPTNLRIVQ